MTEPRKCCKDCENRTPLCHCFCDDYTEYKKELAEYNEIIRKRKEEEYRYAKKRWVK